MAIDLVYGNRQSFRFRHGDINIVGHVDASMPLRRSLYRLNRGAEHSFYVDHVPNPGLDWSYEYKQSPARLRLIDLGDFNIEIPVTAPELLAGDNRLAIEVEDACGRAETYELAFTWEPEPVPIPLELRDLSQFEHIQDVGQVVDGTFDLDPIANVIRPRAPVKPDSLLLLGSPARSQEAEYDFRYFDGSRSKYIGLSDFFVAHEAEDPGIPIKPGWSTAGLATIRPRGEFAWEARVWIGWADRPGWRPNERAAPSGSTTFGVVRTDPPAYYRVEPRAWYHVRHQVLLEDDENTARFRIWPVEDPEPKEWLCETSDTGAPTGIRRHTHASFGLFAHSGLPCEWANVCLRAIER